MYDSKDGGMRMPRQLLKVISIIIIKRVLYSFNKFIKDKDSILDQINEMKQIFLDFYYDDLRFKEWLQKIYI